MTGQELHSLGDFLAALTKATQDHGVRIGAYGPSQVQIADTVLDVRWDEERNEYVAEQTAQ